ncbi:MAG: galactokinase [Lachnospiraceae bacterium]|nr:galactokinase [Lachnospiraceae bacterium]
MNSTQLIELFSSKEIDEKILDIYKDDSLTDINKDRYISTIQRFVSLYQDGDLMLFSAPGRSEVMGNHTDHQHGEVLAAGINLDAIAVVKKRDDNLIKIVSGDYPEMCLDASKENDDIKKGTSLSLIAGICKGLKDRGYKTGGFEAVVTSNVIIGAGLSSSAAFETLIGTILSHLYNDARVSDVEIAIIGQYAENVFFGKPCGLMDQMACSVGSLVQIDFADEKNPIIEKVMYDLSDNGYTLCITDTKGSHADLTDEYAAIPKEMKEIASYYKKDYLLGVTMNDILSDMSELRNRFSDRAVLRAMHFIEENRRVKKGVEALKENDIEKFLSLVKESGRSSYEYLQNVYSNKDVSSQNISIALAVSDYILDDKKEAFRVHGGGFAGTIQAFVLNENVEKYKKTMDSVFGPDSCHALKIRKYGGMRVM